MHTTTSSKNQAMHHHHNINNPSMHPPPTPNTYPPPPSTLLGVSSAPPPPGLPISRRRPSHRRPLCRIIAPAKRRAPASHCPPRGGGPAPAGRPSCTPKATTPSAGHSCARPAPRTTARPRPRRAAVARPPPPKKSLLRPARPCPRPSYRYGTNEVRGGPSSGPVDGAARRGARDGWADAVFWGSPPPPPVHHARIRAPPWHQTPPSTAAGQILPNLPRNSPSAPPPPPPSPRWPATAASAAAARRLARSLAARPRMPPTRGRAARRPSRRPRRSDVASACLLRPRARAAGMQRRLYICATLVGRSLPSAASRRPRPRAVPVPVPRRRSGPVCGARAGQPGSSETRACA